MLKSSLSKYKKLRRSRLKDLFRFAIRRLDEERLPQVAGSLTFTTVLALVPLLTIALAIFTTFPIFNTMRASLDAYFIQNLMPKSISSTIFDNLAQFASKASRMSAVGGVALLFTAVATMATVEHAFNQIWRVNKSRPLLQRVVIYWTILTLGPLMIGVSMTATSLLFTATSWLGTNLPFLSAFLYTLLSVGMTTAALSLMYLTIPNRFVERRDALTGGFVAGVAFEIAKRIFALYIAKFPSYTVIYGTLAAIPIFLIWIYVSWFITLIGAVIVAALPVIKYERWWYTATPGGAFVDAMAILEVLVDARNGQGSAAVDPETLRTRTRLGFDESETLLQAMLDAGWVGRVHNEGKTRTQWGKRVSEGLDSWTLIANPAQLIVADVYRLFVFNTRGNPGLARQVEAAVERGLDQTLQAHFAAKLKTPPVQPAFANT